MGKRTWTKEEEELLEKYYQDMLPIKDIMKLMDKTANQITNKASRLGLTEKYMKKNNVNYKAAYQNYDWCYERYIVLNMSYEDMAAEIGTTARTIQKWCSEKHKLNRSTFKHNKRLNDLQYQIILFGTLGDGHIDKRENHPMYIESHSEDEKEYLFWKYEILKDLCNQEPTYYAEDYYSFGSDKKYLCKSFYRMNTKIIDELADIRKINRLNKITMLNEFGLSLHALDDGCRQSTWQICLAEWTPEEINKYIGVCKDKFGLECHQEKDPRYIRFTAISSKKLDEMILRNIPENLDIVHKKILNNSKIKDLHNIRYIISDGNKIGLRAFCDLKHLSYLYCKDIFDTFNSEYVIEKDFLAKVG